jgi:hypothetical protein
VLVSLFPQRISFTRAAPGQDALAGETRSTWAPVGSLTGVACSIQAEMGGVVDLFSRRGVKITHSVYSRTNLSAVQVGDRGTDQAGKVYIARYAEDMAGRGQVWCVYVEQLP